MARIITQELAVKIIRKLDGQKSTRPGSAHDQYLCYHGDQLIAAISLRRGSEKDQGHDHIPKELNVGPNFARQMAICTKSREDFLIKQGVIQPPLDELPGT